MQRLVHGLTHAGLEVTIACSRNADGLRLAHRNVRWLQTPAWNGPIGWRLHSLAKVFAGAIVKYPEESRRLARQLSQNGMGAGRLRTWVSLLPFARKSWDIIYFPWNSAAIDHLPLLDNCPAVISCRGSQINIAPHDPNRKRIIQQLKVTFDKAAAVHCVSEAIKNEAGRFGLNPAKTRVIRPAVDPDFFSPAASARSNDSTFRIITVGALNWRKGYEYALLTVRRLLDRGVLSEFHIVGDGPERARLLYTLDELELQGYVHLHGHLSPAGVRSQLQQADVFLLSSLSEGLSNAVLEAMACGLPVVTSDCGGMREAVTDGVEGLVAPVRDPDAMATALIRLASDPELRRSWGQAARQRVLNQFTLGRQIEDFISLFQSVL
jgi:colanic acid/amylovoran biosynthesis glycosyltransferase